MSSQCSNFTCCGIVLPSFHALIDHFESVHVLVVSGTGQPVYPSNICGSSLSPPSSPDLSVTSSSDSSHRSVSPSEAGDLPEPLLLEFEKLVRDGIAVPHTQVVLPFPYTPPSPVAKFVTETQSMEVETYSEVTQTKASEDITAPISPVSAPDSTTSDSSDAYAPLPSLALPADAAVESTPSIPAYTGPTSAALGRVTQSRPRPRKLYPRNIEAAEAVAAVHPDPKHKPSVKVRMIGSRPRPPGWRDREKAYKCPVSDVSHAHTVREMLTYAQKPGCMKRYMNPGGLKYHLEKGTCAFANRPHGDSSSTLSSEDTD
jgi:transcription factor SFP1